MTLKGCKKDFFWCINAMQPSSKVKLKMNLCKRATENFQGLKKICDISENVIFCQLIFLLFFGWKGRWFLSEIVLQYDMNVCVFLSLKWLFESLTQDLCRLFTSKNSDKSRIKILFMIKIAVSSFFHVIECTRCPDEP